MVLRRSLLFVLALVVGYRVAYVAVDRVGRAAIAFPWRQSPRMLAGEIGALLRGQVADPVRERLGDARAAVGEGRQAMHRREAELRAENGLRQRRSS